MQDKDGYEIRQYRVVHYVETGYCDGERGYWVETVESHPFATRAEAENLRDEWLRDGKLEQGPWGEIRPTFRYGLFRIRREEESV